jgi:hypothetical protein
MRPYAAKAQALEAKPSNAWAMKMPTLIRPKNAATVSIIAKVLAPLTRTERHPRLHSQKDSGRYLNFEMK